MAHNLRRRMIRQELLDETQEVPAQDEEAQESEGSESVRVSGHDSEYSDATDASSESDVDGDATLDKMPVALLQRMLPAPYTTWQLLERRGRIREKFQLKWKLPPSHRQTQKSAMQIILRWSALHTKNK